MKKNLTGPIDPMESSMQGISEFLPFEASMEQSMCGNSQKIPIPNASEVNKFQRQRDFLAYKKMKGEKTKDKKEVEEDEQNQFLNVGKWNKSKEPAVIRSSYKGQATQKEFANRKEQEKKVDRINQPPATKWENKKYSPTANKAEQPTCENIKAKGQKNGQQTPNSIPKSKVEKAGNNYEQQLKRKEAQQQEEEDQEDELSEGQEEQEQQEEDDQQEQQQEEQEQDEEDEEEQQEQDEEQDEEDEEDEIEEQKQLQQTENQVQAEDKFALGNSQEQYEDSSDAYKTQTVNTSAINQSPKASKWNKKKAPLQTMTKYEKRPAQEEGKKPYHSRLNSARMQQKIEDEIVEDIVPENAEEWMRVEKVLLRLKLLLS